MNSSSSIEGFQSDDEGENISDKNPRYCELTALYWLWKNDNSDYKGLVHYRRYFAGNGERRVATQATIMELLKKAPVILPKRRHYYISTVEQHYSDTFDSHHIDILREVLAEKNPAILPEFEAHMKERSAHIWNMAIMRSDIYDSWCSWLFPILEEVEKRIDFTKMTPFEARVMGRLSERLLDPWIKQHGIDFCELKVVSSESINWKAKIKGFLVSKFFKQKYTESF